MVKGIWGKGRFTLRNHLLIKMVALLPVKIYNFFPNTVFLQEVSLLRSIFIAFRVLSGVFFPNLLLETMWTVNRLAYLIISPSKYTCYPFLLLFLLAVYQ